MINTNSSRYQNQKKFIKYYELLNFLKGREDRRNLIKFKIVGSKIKRSVKRRNKILVLNNSLFRFLKRRTFSQYFINRQVKRTRRQRRRMFGYVRIQKTTNNLFVSLHNKKGTLLYSSSICALGSKGKKDRFGLVSLRQAGEKLAIRLRNLGLYKINIHIRCFLNKGLRNLIWSLSYNKIRIHQIFNFIKIPHGFMTLPSKRRMKRRKSN